jgi:DNA replication and repair protein RecF
LLQYNRIINQRNNLLKKIRERKAAAELLDSWDEQLAKTAVFIVDKRLEAVKKLGMLANLMHRKLTASKENLGLSYQIAGYEGVCPGNLYEWYKENIRSGRQTDILRGSTGLGPHRDDIVLKVNGKDLRCFGSQGQQRTGILALKLAEIEFLKSETGEYPVLLLDDVMSELDGQRREQLLSFIRDKIQTFITATDAALFPTVKIGQYYRVNAGTIVE